jgi:hypothetical protein
VYGSSFLVINVVDQAMGGAGAASMFYFNGELASISTSDGFTSLKISSALMEKNGNQEVLHDCYKRLFEDSSFDSNHN